MKATRVFRPNPKTAEERAHERSLRERLQKERPSLDDLVRTGEEAADIEGALDHEIAGHRRRSRPVPLGLSEEGEIRVNRRPLAS